MPNFKKLIPNFVLVLTGLIIAFLGTAKVDANQIAADEIKSRMAFGAKGSPIEIYFVTDWFCPTCAYIEPKFTKLLPTLQNQATIYFIDFAIHKNSFNYIPYNIAFLLNNKSQYLQARQALSALAKNNETPTDADIMTMARNAGLYFQEVPYRDVKAGMDYFDKVVSTFDLDATPTIIIRNVKTNKQVKMEGRDEISEEKILKALKEVSPTSTTH